MAKVKSAFFCQSCGFESAKWMGKCTSCGEWNTFVEEIKDRSGTNPTTRPWTSARMATAAPLAINDIPTDPIGRLSTLDGEFDRVLGGGLVPGAVVLLGGEPGIGKSTLLLQVALKLKGTKILYVSGEESAGQIKLRADRIGVENTDCYLLAETNTGSLFQQIEKVEPQLLIVDSIQTMQSTQIESAAGSISQVRECAAELIRYAKETGTPVVLVGHITKDGNLAGPKVLEHMVDTVLQFEGDRHHAYRLLRASKNRFGPASELGIYQMQGDGLREVSNPSEIFLSQREGSLSGVAIAATHEGNRPLLLEVQSLVSVASYGTPQRSATGFDKARLNMLLAVLEKRTGFRLSTQDVFLNVAGGMRLEDPAADLSICAAIVSSYEDLSLDAKVCFAGEVGLGGEVRAVARVEARIAEAAKLGFTKILISKFNKYAKPKGGIQVVEVGKLEEVFGELFG